MSKEVGSFQDNIRRTFIRFSLLPVVVMVIFAIVLFAFGWSYFMVYHQLCGGHGGEEGRTSEQDRWGEEAMPRRAPRTSTPALRASTGDRLLLERGKPTREVSMNARRAPGVDG